MRVQKKRDSVVITKRGVPVAKLGPITDQPDPIFGFLKGKVEIKGDLIEPIIPLEDWDCLKMILVERTPLRGLCSSLIWCQRWGARSEHICALLLRRMSL